MSRSFRLFLRFLGWAKDAWDALDLSIRVATVLGLGACGATALLAFWRGLDALGIVLLTAFVFLCVSVGTYYGLRAWEWWQSRQEGFGLVAQRRLLGRLRHYRGSNVKIMFADITHKPSAEQLRATFRLAGWETNLTNVPLEHSIHKYIQGVEVLGYNEHLVRAVADAVTMAGFKGVKPITKVNQVLKTNPKWEWVERHIRITIGYTE